MVFRAKLFQKLASLYISTIWITKFVIQNLSSGWIIAPEDWSDLGWISLQSDYTSKDSTAWQEGWTGIHWLGKNCICGQILPRGIQRSLSLHLVSWKLRSVLGTLIAICLWNLIYCRRKTFLNLEMLFGLGFPRPCEQLTYPHTRLTQFI